MNYKISSSFVNGTKAIVTKVQILIFLFVALVCVVTHAQIISTVVGDNIKGSIGNGGLAVNAEIDTPVEILFDKAGNLYVAEPNYNRIRKVDKSGIISQFAGTGARGFSGDGGPASLAQFYFPSDMSIDDSGNIYVMDAGNYRVRKINTLGIISTIAGNGIASSTGDGGPADSSGIDCGGVNVDDSGNIYIAQSYQNNVRKINRAGIISTVAGNGTVGFGGDGGPATNAEFSTPVEVTADSKGNIYIIDAGNSRVRKVDKSGIITTVIGNGIAGYSGDGVLADSAELNIPEGMAIDSKGNMYVSDYGNNCIRKVTASTEIITTIAGDTWQGYGGDGGPADSAQLNGPVATGLDSAGNIYIADYNNYVIRKVSKDTITGINPIALNNTIGIYPNPSNGVFTIRSFQKGMGTAELSIYNVLGEEVYKQAITQAQVSSQINLSSQYSGTYLYRIISVNGKLIGSGELVIE